MVLFRHARAASVVGQCARQFLAQSIARSTPSLLAHVFPQPVISIRSQTRFNSTVAPATTDTHQSQSDAAESQPQSSPLTAASLGDGSDIPAPATTDTQSPSNAAESQAQGSDIPASATTDTQSQSNAAELLPENSPSTAASPGDGSDIPGLAPYKLQHLNKTEIEAYHRYGPNYMKHLEPRVQKRLGNMAKSRSRFAATAEKEVGSNWFAAMEAYYNDETLRTQRNVKRDAFAKHRKNFQAMRSKQGNMTEAERIDFLEKNKPQYLAFAKEESAYRKQVVEDKLAYMKAAALRLEMNLGSPLYDSAEKIHRQQTEEVADNNSSSTVDEKAVNSGIKSE